MTPFLAIGGLACMAAAVFHGVICGPQWVDGAGLIAGVCMYVSAVFSGVGE